MSPLFPFSFFVSILFHFLRKNSFEFGKLFIFDAGIHGTIEFIDLTITLLEQKDESKAELSARYKSKRFSLANLNERKRRTTSESTRENRLRRGIQEREEEGRKT